jgi:hypothetical protein
MNREKFISETSKLLIENNLSIIKLYKDNVKYREGAIYIHLNGDQMKCFFVSENMNEKIFVRLEQFMKDRIEECPDKIYVIFSASEHKFVSTFLV